jgi:hypothetical protein
LNVDTSFSEGDGVGVGASSSSSSYEDEGPVNFVTLVERIACEKYGSGRV